MLRPPTNPISNLEYGLGTPYMIWRQWSSRCEEGQRPDAAISLTA